MACDHCDAKRGVILCRKKDDGNGRRKIGRPLKEEYTWLDGVRYQKSLSGKEVYDRDAWRGTSSNMDPP